MSETIIQSSKPLLSGKDLVITRTDETNNLTVRGKKEATRTGSNEEANAIKSLLTNLQSMLEVERIDRSCNRSSGVWEPDNNLIKITRKEGNWKLHGYVRNGITYVHPYEGLFLMEMNRLEVFYNGVIVSLEQGYCILLGPEFSIPLEQYIVYSKLMRAGYNVQKYNDSKINSDESFTSTDDISGVEIKNDEESIWNYLTHLLDNKSDTECPVSANIRQSMDEIRENTKSSHFVEDNVQNMESEADKWSGKTVNRKRKRTQTQEMYNQHFKKIKTTLPTESLMSEDEVHAFRDIFDDMNIIQTASDENDEYGGTEGRTFPLHFDLYLPERVYRKSEISLPNYRILVLKSCESPLNNFELRKLHGQNTDRINIIVIYVTESHNFTAFMYHFYS